MNVVHNFFNLYLVNLTVPMNVFLQNVLCNFDNVPMKVAHIVNYMKNNKLLKYHEQFTFLNCV